MPTSYELHLFRPKPSALAAGSPRPPTAQRKELATLDQRAIGDFLLSLGPAIRFGGQTDLGEQYLYEDKQGYAMEIMASEKQVAIGYPSWYRGEQAEQMRRIAFGIALALVARFGLTLYDPQRARFVRASRTHAQQ